MKSNEEMEGIMKIVKSLEDSGLLFKGVREKIQNEVKEQKEGFLSMLLGASLLGNMVTDKGIIRAGYDFKGKGIIRAGYGSKVSSIKYYQDDPRFNGAYSRDNLPNEINNAAYVINLDKYSDIGTHWIALYALINNVTYFDSFGYEHIPK